MFGNPVEEQNGDDHRNTNGPRKQADCGGHYEDEGCVNKGNVHCETSLQTTTETANPAQKHRM
jgi:hypothetical protein